jgi:aryl carrier-like protein
MAEDTTIADRLRRAVSDVVGIEPEKIAGDTNLVVLGMGSLELMRLVNRWRKDGYTVDFKQLAEVPTIDAWSRHLERSGR